MTKPRECASSAIADQNGLGVRSSRTLAEKQKWTKNISETMDVMNSTPYVRPRLLIKPKTRRPDEKTTQWDMNTKRVDRTDRPKVKGITASEPINDFDPPSSESSEGFTDNEVSGRSEQRAHRIIHRERLRRTLFVGNLPMGVKRRDLVKMFMRVLKHDDKAVESGCRVESVRLRGVVPVTGGTGKMARRRAVIQGEFSAGVSQNMIAYVVLTSTAGVPAALSLNGHWLEPNPRFASKSAEGEVGSTSGMPQSATGRYIRVDSAARRTPTEHPMHCVFLGNLPFEVHEDEVRGAMSTFGAISNVRLIRDKETGAVKGFGFVQFVDPTSIALAIRATGTVLVRNRPIRIQEWHPSEGDRGKPAIKRKLVSPHKSNDSRKKPRSDDGHKRWSKLEHTGKAKGITLPSNLRGVQRDRFLKKRLMKKRKRQLRRQHGGEPKNE
ncbi:hypothetical protein P879_04189 [Paragonimus westermani]|uniref:RRM domain-containing protein n=1 Tax=Paragonimus westermani TaxID=34504 RepID=A0A8T0DN67_9TREM|nr:hypothetical protein P879_04189 [Paragonimus westermani]